MTSGERQGSGERPASGMSVGGDAAGPVVLPAPGEPGAEEAWVRRALALAQRCAASEDVPVGALVLDEAGRVIGEGWNRREELGDPLAHAECLALQQAAQARGEWRLEGCTLVVTLEPCLMCAGALVNARVPRVVFGAWDDKAGACGSVWDVVRDRRAPHRVEVHGGVLQVECGRTLVDFFVTRRSM